MSFGILSALVTIIHIICIFLPYWMHIDSEEVIGIFHSVHEHSSSIYETNCNDNMGEMECGYLKSFQVAGVVSVIFGGITTLLYFFAPNYLNDLISFFAITGTLIQACFGLITFVLFYYFKTNYFDDDGVNQEYPTAGENDTHLMVGYYLWLTFNAITWMMVIAGYFLIYNGGYQKKGALNL
jgi:hypothetical protein